MGADLSRVRFDPRHDYNRVVQQQGRVMLDADGNEQADLLDRRARAQSADLGSFGPATGIAGTAVVPRTTPDAFKLSFIGSALQLGRGRMYVDGILAENHGTGTEQLDPLLGELRGTSSTPYLAQPYWKNPTALPASGRHLVYLEVRERELTWVEQPDLVDEAMTVDTTARTQVIWQVRVHAPHAPAMDCTTPDADIPGWGAVIAPTTSRLTVGTMPVPPATNPCSLPPSGDYRGLENQTYRVEIHQGGLPGTATFLWSRDNGSVTVPVIAVSSSSRLRLASLGKDADALGLASGQWVEILDDDHELDGQPGELRQITVHPEDRSVSFSPALPAGWPTTADAAARHLRVRRWDSTTGAVTVPTGGAAVELEHGITVSLTASGAGFRTGEYWVFAARTATTSVEELTAAPPLGPHRHYARIGIIEGATVLSELCPPLWPPTCDCDDEDCACTVCVSVADHVSGTFTIQDGLDIVAKTGGAVCLQVGTYPLRSRLTLGGASGVRLRGQGPATVLTTSGDGIAITGSTGTTVQDLSIVSAGREGVDPQGGGAPAAAVRVSGCFETSLVGLVLTVSGKGPGQAAGVALHDLCLTTRVRDSVLDSPVGVHAIADLKVPLMLDDLEVSGNTVHCDTTGVLADEAVLFSHGTWIRENRIEAGADAGVRLHGVVEPSGQVRVEANHVGSRSDGIVVAAGVAVADNTVVGAEGGADETVGIAVTPPSMPGEVTSEVSGNTVSGFATAAVVESGGEPVRVLTNRASRCGNGIRVSAQAAGADVHLDGNQVHDIAERGEGSEGVFGLMVAGAGTLQVSGNTVGRIGVGWHTESPIVGIGIVGTVACRVSGNEVFGIGPATQGATSYDYAAVGTLVGTVEGNQSLHDLTSDGQIAFGLRVLAAGKVSFSSKTAGIGAAGGAAGAAGGGSAVFATEDVVLVQTIDDREPSMTVGENTFMGGFRGAAVEAAVRGTLLFDHNHCTAPRGTRGAVRVQAGTAAVSGNRVQGGEPSMLLDVPNDRLTVLGNLVSDGLVATGGLDPRWAPLNLDGVS